MGRFLHVQIYNEAGTEVEYDNLTDTDWGIQAGSASLSSHIMENELRFGNIYASMFQITLFNLDVDLRGRKIKVGINYNTGYNYIVDGAGNQLVDGAGNFIVYRDMADVSDVLFYGTIESSKKDRGGTYREITAYDKLYWLRDVNVAPFWEEYWNDNETSTLEDFRDELLEYVGLTFVSKTLLNDDLVIQNYFEQPFTQLRFQDLLKMVCELQNSCPHINANEQIEFITLDRANLHDIRKKVEGQNSTWEDFTTEEITGVAIYSTGDELSQVVGEEDNVYNIVGNVFLMGMTAQELTSVANSLLDELSTITFVPGTFKLILSEPSWKLGEILYTEYGIAYILDIRFSGSVLIDETITCRQTDAFLNKNVDSHNDTVIEGLKLASVTKTVDSLTVDYADFKEEAETTFEIMAGATTLRVDNQGRIVEMSLFDDPDEGATFELNADYIKFEANKKLDLSAAQLAITSDNFELDEDGNLTCTSADVSGKITSSQGTIGGWTISSSGFTANNGLTQLVQNSNGGYLEFKHPTNYGGLTIDRTKIATYKDAGAIISYVILGTYPTIGLAAETLTISGSKSRVVTTNDYGDRLLYCYETPTPMFGDIGEGTIADDGKCYVWLDPTFAQTIADTQYQVFLQKYGQGECWVSERTSNYFIVEGTQGLSFGWELKAKQRDYSEYRLDDLEIHRQWADFVDYGSLSIEHRNNIQSEREVV